jgi:hypothetical protein
LLNRLRTAVASRDGDRQIEIMRQLGSHARRERKELRSLGWTVCANPRSSLVALNGSESCHEAVGPGPRGRVRIGRVFSRHCS